MITSIRANMVLDAVRMAIAPGRARWGVSRAWVAMLMVTAVDDTRPPKIPVVMRPLLGPMIRVQK